LPGQGGALILIFSLSRDQATNGVIPWIDRYGGEFLRINDDEPEDPPARIEMDNADVRFRVGGRWYSTSEISAVWYRKGSFWFPDPLHEPDFPDDPALTALMARKLKRENLIAGQYFHHLVKHKGIKVLGNPFLGDPNKLILLHEADKLGLKVPKFDVTNRLNDCHLASPSAYITKSLSDGVYLWDVEGIRRGYFTYTEELSEVLAVGNADGDIPLSLVQEKIAKTFEIRAFYLDGAFVSSAIYSQGDPQTAIDYRKYNQIRPNRNVPMALPRDVEEKLSALFRKLELNTGSVDMIVDTAGEFVLLEINPVGIYGGMTSVCNFSIDQAIARWLCGGKEDDWRLALAADGATA